jgi:hypothetical protein
MKYTRISILALMAVCAMASVRAADVSIDDVINLSQRNLAEDVIVAAVEASPGAYNLSADDIIHLKEAKVSDKVIAVMIRHHQGVARAGAPLAPVAPAAVNAAEPVIAAAPAVGNGFGVLNIENLDDKVWSYSYEPDTQTIWFSAAAEDGRGNVQPHSGISVRMPTGAYTVRYNGQDQGQKVSVFGNEKSLLMVSRVETAEVEALYVSVFERGERKASGRLVTLRENAAPREDNLIRRASASNDGAAVERVVRVQSAPSVVYASSPVVYSAPSVVYASYGYPSYAGYYGGYYGGYYPRYSSYSYPRYYSSYRNYCAPTYYGGYRGGSYYGGGYYGRGGYSRGYVGGSYYSGGHRGGVSVHGGFHF